MGSITLTKSRFVRLKKKVAKQMNGYVAIALGQVRHSPDSIMICSFEEVTIR